MVLLRTNYTLPRLKKINLSLKLNLFQKLFTKSPPYNSLIPWPFFNHVYTFYLVLSFLRYMCHP